MNSIVKQNYLEILKTFFLGLVFLAIGSFAGVFFIPYSIKRILNIAFFIVVLFSLFSRRGGFIRNKSSMYIYALILGILSGSAYVYYFYRLGSGIFISVVLGVVLIFGIAYIIAARSSDEDILNSYLDQILYMNGEAATSDIGLGDTEEYKKLYESELKKDK